MKNALFVGFNYHLKTNSCDFILRELEANFAVTKIYITNEINSEEQNFSNLFIKKFDLIIYWQIIPKPALAKKYIEFKKGIFFPMYDAVPSRRRIEKWWQIRNFQIISFSRLLHKELKALGLSSHNIKYYPKPSKEIIYGDPYSAFFWHRHDSISSNDAELICKNLNLKHLHIHRASDPGHEANHENKFGEIRKTYSDWFKSQDELRALISKSAYFIAPRNKEGIGMAYLEAMGQGKCVIAKNNSTMNEYIKNKKNGILYGNKFKKSDINLKEIQQNAYISSLKGHEKWKKEKELILKYIKADTKTNKLRLYLMVIIGLTTNPGRVIKALLNK